MHTMAEIPQEEESARPDTALANEMERMAAILDAKIAADIYETVDPAAARKLFAALIKVYALRTEAGEREFSYMKVIRQLQPT